MESQSINDVLLAYKSYLESAEKPVKAHQVFSQTQTAITRHLISGWDESLMPKSSRQLTKIEKALIQKFLEKTSVSKLSEALKVQETVFEKYNVTLSSRNVYKSRLDNFIDWVKKQGWIESKSGRSSSSCAPKMRHGHSDGSKKILTNRPVKLKNYSLKTHPSWNKQQVEKLAKEVSQFYNCLVDKRYPGRLFDPVKPITANGYVGRLYDIFGWLANYKGIQPEQLSLDFLVPTSLEALDNNLKVMVFTEPAKKLIKQKASLENQIAQYVDTWICDLLNFLEQERCCQSAGTHGKFLVSIHALVRYQYMGKTKDVKYKDIPIMSEINKHRATCRKTAKNQKPIANQKMKWLNLEEVHTQTVEPLRLECECRYASHRLRSITGIARSFRLFLAWGLSTYRAPRRQQELRGLKITLSCQIKDKPKNLAPNQFIHPLPCNRDTDKEHGYLYKDKDGIWCQDMTPESYKTGTIYGTQDLKIPNPKFPDGKYFYDYLEAYLYGYWRDREGNWVSAGNTTELPGPRHKLYALRMAFSPKNEYNFVFVGSRKGKSFNDTSFGVLFKDSAYRLTGQLLTPHLLRDIHASWFLSHPYSEDIICSLAYAMGHSVKVMRKSYDRRNEHEKRGPIQQKLEETINQFSALNKLEDLRSNTPPEKIDPVLWAILTPEQKTMYQSSKELKK